MWRSKKKLAEKLDIIPSRLTRWLQGQVDPAAIEISAFYHIARVKGCSVDELAKLFEFPDIKQQPIDKFRTLIKELLFDRTQEELGKKIGVSQISISNWLNPDIPLTPGKIPAPTMFALAQEKGWSLKRLLIYLDFEPSQFEQNILSKYQLEFSVLSLAEQKQFLNWLSNLVDNKQEKSSNFEQVKLNKNRVSDLRTVPERMPTLLIILEQENIAIASNYLQKLYVHTNINPENIMIATIQQLPDPIDSDTLIFDISAADSPSIALIEEISFDGDIVVFTSEDLPENVRAGLEDKVSDVLIKPIDWSSLKDKEYFR